MTEAGCAAGVAPSSGGCCEQAASATSAIAAKNDGFEQHDVDGMVTSMIGNAAGHFGGSLFLFFFLSGLDDGEESRAPAR